MKEINLQVLPHADGSYDWYVFDSCHDNAEAISSGNENDFVEAWIEAKHSATYLITSRT